MAASTARHETRALLRAHLAAASGYRHLTRHCPICHQLLRLAMEPSPPRRAGRPADASPEASVETAVEAAAEAAEEETAPPA
ncbi:DUF6274 family protein [Streptomyces sp. NPDC051219]|uniref:DUF6274 family protein n=1 Tax=Streptomyces sp. NPDC051219 TaxID=3155283 RepID=UPI003437AE90